MNISIDKMAMHYYLHNKEDERPQEHRRAFNTSCMGQIFEDNERESKKLTIISQNNPQYTLPLIPEELDLIVYQEGSGKYSLPGEYITVRERVYFDGQNPRQFLPTQRNYIFGRKRNPVPLELSFSMMKIGAQAKIVIKSKEMISEIIKIIPSHIKKTKKLIYQIKVLKISMLPSESDNLLDILYIELMDLSIEGDRAFQQWNLQKAIANYEKAIEKIFSRTFDSILFEYRKKLKIQLHENKQIKPPRRSYMMEEKDEPLTQAQRKRMYRELDKIKSIEDIAEKIAVKGIELAYIVKQYFKAIKWGYVLLQNPNHYRNIRILLVRVNSFLELNQKQEAFQQLKVIKMLYPNMIEIDEKIESLRSSVFVEQQLTREQKREEKKRKKTNMDYLKVAVEESIFAKKTKEEPKKLKEFKKQQRNRQMMERKII